jgi:signal peptidase I
VSYLLELLCPGFGHISANRWILGPVMAIVWISGICVFSVLASFDVRNLVAIGGLQLVLGGLGCLRLWRLRRLEKTKATNTAWAVVLMVLLLLLYGGVFVVLTQTLVRPTVVQSGSMMPAINTGDVLLAQLFGPMIFGVARGDIVLVAHPTQAGKLLVKRILGLTGDLIEIRGGVLHRNGHSLSQCRLRTYHDPETKRQVIERLEVQDRRPYLVWDLPEVMSKALTVRVPPGQVFVAGDNRDRSGDSRSFGTLPVASIRALIRVRLAPSPANEIDRAPMAARKAAYQRCLPRGRGDEIQRRTR